MRRLLTFTLGVTVLASALAAPAAADSPTIVEKNNTVTRHFEGLTDCSDHGFTMTADFQVQRSVTDFYDSSGTLLREVVHARFVGTSTNELTGGSLPTNGVRHIVFDFVNGTFIETGVLRHVTVPGEGIVLHESGRIVTDLDTEELLFAAGPHQLFAGDIADFCAALAAS